MNYSIDRTKPEPAYLQLYRLIARDIVQGIYPKGSRLPSKRTIAAETGVSIITAEHVLSLLCEEGYIQSRERSGYYVIYNSPRLQSSQPGQSKQQGQLRLPEQSRDTRQAGWTRQPDDTVRQGGFRETGELQSGEKGKEPAEDESLFPFSVLARTMRKVLQDDGSRILVKSPGQGSERIRREIASYLARSRGMAVEPGQIIIGSGAEYLYSLAAQLLGKNMVFALEQPSYEKIRLVYESMNISCEMLPLTEEGINAEALKHSRAQVLHVTPFNSYPSGVSVSISKKYEYLQWAECRNGWIIEDNYDSELTVSKKEEDSLFALAEGKTAGKVIYINTFSRTIAPSMRIGYMILPDNLLKRYRQRLGFYSCTVPLFEQYVIAELLRSGDFERHINRVRRRKRKEANPGESDEN